MEIDVITFDNVMFQAKSDEFVAIIDQRAFTALNLRRVENDDNAFPGALKRIPTRLTGIELGAGGGAPKAASAVQPSRCPAPPKSVCHSRMRSHSASLPPTPAA